MSVFPAKCDDRFNKHSTACHNTAVSIATALAITTVIAIATTIAIVIITATAIATVINTTIASW